MRVFEVIRPENIDIIYSFRSVFQNIKYRGLKLVSRFFLGTKAQRGKGTKVQRHKGTEGRYWSDGVLECWIFGKKCK